MHRVKIMTGPELEAAGAMQQHYGVINQISREGRPALTEAAEQALQDSYGDALDGSEVIGGHQFLDRYPEVSAYALAMLFANADVQRLGPGTYAARLRMDADQVVVLNGFHPRQLGFFTAADATCAFLHGSSDTDWEALRSELIGATDPAKAAAGSIRGRLKADPAAYGLSTVNSNFNGVHMSAGPLEGLGELDRFFGEVHALPDWTFAAALRDAGLTDDDLPGPAGQPGDHRGRRARHGLRPDRGPQRRARGEAPGRGARPVLATLGPGSQAPPGPGHFPVRRHETGATPHALSADTART